MTVQMNIAEAKAKLSELIARAEAGEEVVIARDGKPAVALVPLGPIPLGSRKLGLWDGVGGAIPETLFLGPDREIEAALTEWETARVMPAR